MPALEIALAVTVGYAIATVAYVAYFVTQRKHAGLVGAVVLMAAVAAHTAWLVLARLQLGHLPLVTKFEALSFVAWGIALAYVVIELWLGQRVFGAFVIPVALLLQAGVLLASPGATPSAPLRPIFQSGWFELHVITALFSYCAFAIAFAAGLMYLLLSHELRLKQLGFFFRRLPPLDSLARINYQAVALGFLFLTIGIGTGVIWSLSAQRGLTQLGAKEASKEISAIIVWLLYAANIHMRWRRGWRGRRAALFSVLNFILLFAAYCLTSLVLKAHQF